MASAICIGIELQRGDGLSVFLMSSPFGRIVIVLFFQRAHRLEVLVFLFLIIGPITSGRSMAMELIIDLLLERLLRRRGPFSLQIHQKDAVRDADRRLFAAGPLRLSRDPAVKHALFAQRARRIEVDVIGQQIPRRHGQVVHVRYHAVMVMARHGPRRREPVLTQRRHRAVAVAVTTRR